MEATILNTDFEAIGVIDFYKSFIWSDRFDEYGDFEIYLPIGESLPDNIKKGYYLWNADSDRIMIVETIKTETDEDDGEYFVVSGRSAETLLMRRIIWNKKVFSRDDKGVKPNLLNGIKTMLMENAIDPVAEVRKIPNLIFEESTDEKITSLTFEGEYLGEDLYTVVHNLCVEKEIGFKITLNNEDKFVFKLYAGVDHSYGTEEEPQIKNPYVIFSPEYDNLMSAKYLDSDEKLKNVTLVVGESQYDENGNEVSRISYELGSAAGMERREVFTDATSLSLDDGDGGVMTADQYQAHLRQKGIDTLMEHTSLTALEAEINPDVLYVYREDYFIGDIVQIVDQYGQEARAYISEYVMSHDDSGSSAYPTFKIIQKGVYET